jgi:hypothetical protein
MSSPGHGEKLSRKQEQAIAALLSKSSIVKAAAAAGVAEKTLRLWLKDASFQDAYRTARREVVEGSIARLQRATVAAVRTLRKALTCGHSATEVRAAIAILEHASRGVELVDLAQRIKVLEQARKQEGK